ncbi:MAG: energy transducer TonB [Rhodothermaceae bacterium]|nr:energy transducer TonB [Bacteroidota bacterium]MXX97058.1 energy transducer TonB [Rhodothermaceae bacterium]MXZ16626.1 energy transducer TonB [Rhodothermaceae bacterium]MXZ57147.1 energy transducer TonB [Rhodothermaceae bacterium]MYB90845.1 energy transducer TonB [Rhodothermaceae bacterium]
MRRHFDGDHYTLRLLASILVAQVLVLLCIKLWPLPLTPGPLDITYSDPEAIQMEEIVTTRQTRLAPPPPPPLPPVIRPEDIILEEDLTLDFNPLTVTGPPMDEIPAEPEGIRSTGIAASEPPKPIRIVTPEYPRSAQRRKIRAEVVITLVVDQRGEVRSPQVLERYLLDEKENTRTLVDELGYGLEEAAINAAMRSLFRPARKEGVVVASNHKLTFKFGS